jgi:hypothetical protein
MSITPSGLIRAAGLAAAAAGAIFIGVQIAHPPMEVASLDSANWVLRNVAKIVMTGLALAGLTGLYARQVRQTGVLGLVGYLAFSTAYLLMLPAEMVAGFVLPAVSEVAPGFAGDVLVSAFGGSPVGDIGLLPVWFAVTGVLFTAGGLLFGIALFRAGIVARWAAALLSASTVGTMLLAVLPDSFNRPMAVPTGIALIGLGVSLWRSRPGEGDVDVDVTTRRTVGAVVR